MADLDDEDGYDTNDCSIHLDPPVTTYEITPLFVEEVTYIKKLLDTTGLSLTNLLTFWMDISAVGEKSLYSQLFLKRNIVGIDPIFKADQNGNYLTFNVKISDHYPVLMKAFQIRSVGDLLTIKKDQNMSDDLNLSNVSKFYRYSLLAKVLSVKISILPDLHALFGHSFEFAKQADDFFQLWNDFNNVGFTFSQVNYIVRDKYDIIQPIRLSKLATLKLPKTMYQRITAIASAQADLMDDPTQSDPSLTSDLVSAKLTLFV